MAPASPHEIDQFRIVCIGGSAGSFSAYREILQELPFDLGMAVIVLGHRGSQSPELLVKLLGGITVLPVEEVMDGVRLEPNQIFVVPPNAEITTDGINLNLTLLGKKNGWPTTIDTFFRSLAKGCAERAVAIIVSGMGFDGSLALAAVRSAGGMTFAQSDATHSSMPDAAIETGNVDFVLTATEIGRRLAKISASPWEI